MRPLKVIGITAPRSGSSYWFVNYRRFLAQNTPDVAYLAECFHPAYQEEDFKFDNNLLEVASKKSNKKRNHNETRNQNRVTLDRMINSRNSWVAKVFPTQLTAANQSKFWNYVNHSSDRLRRVFLYRRDLEDRVLSKFFADHTGMFKTNQVYDYTDITVDYTSNMWYLVREYILEQRDLFNMYDHCDWDHIVCYEDLIGDPVADMQNCFPERELQPLETNLKKLITKEDKINQLNNYKQFRETFLDICDRMNVDPMGDPQ